MKTAILGASGLVGRTMLDLLADCAWVDEDPVLLTSVRSVGRELSFRGRPLSCRPVAEAEFAGVELALFSAGASVSREQAPLAAARGTWVIDNSSAWRLDPEVPLVVPEVNDLRLPDGAHQAAAGGIVANPNCSTIQIALALAPLQAAFGLREVHVTTLQSVSGAGQKGLDELRDQVAGATRAEAFPRQIAANVIPQIGRFAEDGSCAEERKVVDELRKIHELPDLQVTCTVTRVPVWIGHAAACRVVLGKAVNVAEATAAMADWPGLDVASEPAAYLTPLEIAGRKTTHVGRLRRDPGREDALLFWVVADNLLKGAAWNAVQIAEAMVARRGTDGCDPAPRSHDS